ncbi:MAG: hypothetical protein AAGJ31_06490 [Verrucomicrobiota bacterium]
MTTRSGALLSTLCAVSFVGCLPLLSPWWEGKWVYDEETTKQVNDLAQEADSGRIVGGLRKLVGGALEEVATLSLDGAVIEMTGSEIRTFQDEAGHAVSYKVVEKPAADTVVLQKEGGEIVTYHREGAGIWFKPFKGRDLKVYLKPAG